MATVTLRPNGTISTGGWAINGGSATIHAALSDNSDATFVDALAATGQFDVEFTTAVFPALAQIRALVAKTRASQVVVNDQILHMTFRITGLAGDAAAGGDWKPSSTISTFTGPSKATKVSGEPWTTADIDAIRLAVGAGFVSTTDDMRVYEAYIDVTYNEAPVATVTAPAEASTITNDSSPNVSWTYSDPETDAQERYRVKVFSAAQYGAVGFDPSTSAAAWDSGDVVSSATTVEIGSPLPNATYRAYVRVADVGSSGRFGAWDFNEFIVNVTAPPVPVLTATADNTLKRVALTATSTGLPAVEFMRFEYSDDAGATWSTVRGGTKVATIGDSATIHDYESLPNTARQYRAKAGRTVA